MSKDAEKIKKDFVKLEKMVPALGKDARRDVKTNFSNSEDLVGEAKKHIQDMVVEANEKGAVKGNDLAKLMSYAGFKNAVAIYQDRAKKHQLIIDKMKYLDQAGADLEKQFNAVQTEINKKLGKILRKLQPKLQKEIDEISKKIKIYSAEIKPKNSLCSRITGEDQQIAKIWKKQVENIVVNTNIDKVKESRSEEVALRKLDDRVMKTSCSKCAGFARDTEEACEEALKVYETDAGKARKMVKEASKNINKIKEIHGAYLEILKDKELFKIIAKSKDRATILKRIDLMKTKGDDAQRFVKGAVTAFNVLDKTGGKVQ